jgi:endonuclease YncB( thermonuclease family)
MLDLRPRVATARVLALLGIVVVPIVACAPAPQQPTASAAGIPPEAHAAVVTRVVDGDTIWVRPQLGGEQQRVRLLEIDAPETGGGPECYGAQATAFATAHLAVGSIVYLTADREDTDQFGRMLRYVWTADGTFFNEEAVRQGYARAVLFEPNDRFIGLIRDAEAEARRAGRGLWNC